MTRADMIVVHAIWTDPQAGFTDTALHLWGENGRAGLPDGASNEDVAGDSARDDDGGSTPAVLDTVVDPEALRSVFGDLHDALLASGGTTSELLLMLPHANSRVVLSSEFAQRSIQSDGEGRFSLKPRRVATLAFSPADAVDLLTGLSGSSQERFVRGDSLRYWTKFAEFVLGLLAGQQYVPALFRPGKDRFHGYWRAVVDDERDASQLQAFLTSMPPVCRSVVRDRLAGRQADLQAGFACFTGQGSNEAASILESFLQATLDALVRRCLDGDDMAHALLGRPAETDSPLRRWLRSLVGPKAALLGSTEDCERVHRTVQEWLSKLEQLPDHRSYRSCFRLNPPTPSHPTTGVPPGQPWRLTLHVQDINRSDSIVDASELAASESAGEPHILKRPFDDALDKLRTDVGKAARHFPALAPCAAASGPVEIELTLQEAYTFLRDAAPILELEGFGVLLPNWWREDRPRMRMWLDLHPSDESSTSVADLELGLETVIGFDWRVAVGDESLTVEELRQLASSKEPLVQVRGRWTEVQSTEIQSALTFLQQRRDGRMTVFEALRLCYAADDLDTGLPVAGIRSSGWIDQLLGGSQTHRSLESLEPPAAFRGTLRPYQIRGMEWLTFLSRLGLGACLADDMGLGKTIQLIALLLREREDAKPPGPTLLVVPMSLVGNWQRELERFGPSLDAMVHHGTERLTGKEFVAEVAKHDVVISTYSLIPRDLEHIGAVDWHRVVLDEAQNIKNPVAKQAVAIRSLRAIHRIAMTGTPVENRLSELWSIMDFLNVGYLGNASEFRRRFAVPIERHHDSDRAGRLRDIIRPFLLRRLKNDPLIEVDLPEKMEMKVYCNLTKEQAGLYQAVVDNMLGEIDSVDGIKRRGMILVALVKLKQVCNHPAQFLKDSSPLAHRSGKCNRLVEMLEEVVAEGDNALIFTQFRRMAEMLEEHLRDRFKREILLFHGGTPRKKRDEIVERFQDDSIETPILILSLKAGGFGLNLTAANHVFHFDRWWNPAVEQQATDRAHRIGQVRRVQVHKFVCIGTLEERIDALLEKKKNLADRIVGTGEKWLTELSTDKLREVLELSREAVAEP